MSYGEGVQEETQVSKSKPQKNRSKMFSLENPHPALKKNISVTNTRLKRNLSK